RYLRKDRKVVSASLSVSMVRDRDDRPRYFIAQMEDVTLREHAEREREELLRWLRAVLDQCPVAIVLVHGEDGGRVEANGEAQKLLGVRLDRPERLAELLFCNDGSPLPPEELPSARAMRGERVEWAELQLRRPAMTGASVPVAVSAGPIRGAAGEVRGAVVTLQDITPVRELERLRAEWSSIVAHDLRQPLHMIAVQTSLLLRGLDVDRPEDVRRAVEQIRGSVGRLNRMIG